MTPSPRQTHNFARDASSPLPFPEHCNAMLHYFALKTVRHVIIQWWDQLHHLNSFVFAQAYIIK